MDLIDTHCHLDMAEFDADRDQVWQSARSAGVKDLVLLGVTRTQWPSLVQFCQTDPHLHLSLGLHPVYLNQHQENDIADLALWVAREKPVAIGEIGLDFYLSELDRMRQLELFEQQLDIAEETQLPVLLHVRKAHEAVLNALKVRNLSGGICHAFNGSLPQAHRYLDLGFKLGFGGMVTFERSSKLRALAKALPDDAIVLETDAPDLSPASQRYQRNSPEFLPEVLHALAKIRGQTPLKVANFTTTNAQGLLKLAEP